MDLVTWYNRIIWGVGLVVIISGFAISFRLLMDYYKEWCAQGRPITIALGKWRGIARWRQRPDWVERKMRIRMSNTGYRETRIGSKWFYYHKSNPLSSETNGEGDDGGLPCD